MSRPKIPILLYCADENRLSVACFSLSNQTRYLVRRASCTHEVDMVLQQELLRGALVLRGAKSEQAVLNKLTRVPVAICGGESVPGCVMFSPDTESMIRALEEIVCLKRGPTPKGAPYHWRMAVSGASNAWV